MSEKSKDKLECDVKFVRMDPMKIAMKSLKRAEAMADSIPDDIQEAIDKASDFFRNQVGSYFYYEAADKARHYEEEEEEDKKNTNKPARTSKVMKNEQGELEFDLYFAFSKFDEEQGIVAGIVYEPDVKDAQGDSASSEEIEKACHDFMANSQQIGLMHEKNVSDKVKIIECYIARAPFELNGQMVRKGSWVMVLKIEDDSIKQDIKDGKLTGLSMSGTATNMAA